MSEISIGSAHRAAFALLSGREHMPAALWGAFTLGSKVRMVWHSWRAMNTVQKYTDTENFYPLIKGGMAQVCANKFTFLRVFAYYCLVTHRFKACKDTIQKISLKLRHISPTLKGQYVPIAKGISRKHKFGLLSPSKANKTAKSVQKLGLRMFRALGDMFVVIKELGRLFFQMLDAADAICVNPFNKEHDVRLNELFINGKGFLNNLIEGQETVINMLEDNEDLFRDTMDKNKKLHGVKQTKEYTYDTFLSMVKRAKRQTESAQRVANKLDGLFDQFIYHATTGAAICLGFTDWAKMVPSPKSHTAPVIMGEMEIISSTSDTETGSTIKLF